MSNKQQLPGDIASVSRVLRSRRDARESYDSLSSIYDLIAYSEHKFTRLALQLLAIEPTERVLDIGCGTGRALVDMAMSTCPNAEITGCDLSPGMLSKTRIKLRRRKVDSAVNLVCVDAANVPVRSATFDALLMSFTLELFDTPEIPVVLSECRRVLIPGGRLAVVSLAKTTSPGWMERGYEWFHIRREQWADCRPITSPEFVREAHFSIQNYHRKSMWGLPVDLLLAIKPITEN